MAITDSKTKKKLVKFKTIFARNLDDLSKRSSLQPKELATIFGVSARQYRRWRNPLEPDLPKHYVMPQIAEYFKVSIDQLYSAKGVGFARNNQEIKLLEMIRLGKRNLPIELIYEALTMLLGGMSNGDRISWMEIGHRLSNYYSQTKKAIQEGQDKEE